MSTIEQYRFFKSVYDEETARRAVLQERAKTYLSLATLYSAFILFVAKELQPDTPLLKIIFAAAVCGMLAAFLFALWSIKVTEIEGLIDPEKTAEKLDSMSEEEFFDDRIADFAVASHRNARINDHKADQQIWAGYCILVGIFLHGCYFLVKLI